MRNIRKVALSIGMTATVLGALVVASAPASAAGLATPPTTPVCSTYWNGTTVCVSASADKATTPTIHVSDTAIGIPRGKTQVTTEIHVYKLPAVNLKKCEYVGHNPPKRWTKGHSLCIKVAVGTAGTNSWSNVQHKPVYFSDHVKAGKWQYFIWNKKIGSWQNRVCHNLWKFHGKYKVVPRKSLIYVHTFSKYTATAKATSVAMGTGWASATCTLNGASAYSVSEYSFDVAAVAKASASAYSESKARILAMGKANVRAKAKAEAAAKAQTSIKAEGSATANAQCITVSTPPVVTPPTCTSVYGPGYNGTYPYCYKDGTSTPPPPTSAPGPNPTDPPVGAPGGSGSFPCWSTTTGAGSNYEPGTTVCPPGYIAA